MSEGALKNVHFGGKDAVTAEPAVEPPSSRSIANDVQYDNPATKIDNHPRNLRGRENSRTYRKVDGDDPRHQSRVDHQPRAVEELIDRDVRRLDNRTPFDGVRL